MNTQLVVARLDPPSWFLLQNPLTTYGPSGAAVIGPYHEERSVTAPIWETLIADARAEVTPAEMVERKLIASLGCLRLSDIRIAANQRRAPAS
jgi:hypothetical protein